MEWLILGIIVALTVINVQIIAAIEDPPVIIKILAHLGLPTRAPAQGVDLFQTI